MKLKLLFFGICAGALANGFGATNSLDASSRDQTVTAIARLLSERYTFPDTGDQMAGVLRDKLAREEYNDVSDGPTLAMRLTRDLQAISHDKHLRVHYSTEPLRRDMRAGEPNETELADHLKAQRRENGGVDKAEVLPGNIGYLHLNYFGLASVAGPRIAGAMQFLSGTDALIIDIRDNGGAIDPGTIAILCSYFFPEERVHLNSLVWREGNRVEQSWTLPLLPGPRYLDRPVYVLTSGRTFSGAEEFAYNLQTRKRATIVGAKTGGGANPGGTETVNDHFAVWIPTGHALNPVTSTNWEGTGVRPDIAMKPARALLGVQKLALDKLIAAAAGDGRWQTQLKQRLAEVERELERPLAQATFTLPGFAEVEQACVVGSFNKWRVGEDQLRRGPDGWAATLDLEPGTYSYKFWVDGQWITDPQNTQLEITPDGYTNSVFQVRQSPSGEARRN